MARRNNVVGALLAMGALGLTQSGAFDRVIGAGPDEESYMSSDNPWSVDHEPARTGAVESPVYYRNCDAARAAGAAPVRIGDPGYAPHLDRDSDGVGCEPYRGR